MTQNEFNALVNQDLKARVAAAQVRYEAELAGEEGLEADTTLVTFDKNGTPRYLTEGAAQ
jgi:hypothetical protein